MTRTPRWTPGLLLVLACSPGPGEATSAGASTGGATSTSADPPTTGGIGGSETSADATGGASMDGTTATATGGSTTSVATTTDATSGGPTGVATGEASSGGSSDDGTTGVGGLVLEPETLEDFWLPINSIRAGVGGFDAATQTCVSVIFFFDSHPDALAQHCSFDPMGLFPYVIVTPDSAPPCQQWDYGGNVTVTAAAGCMQVISEDPIDIAIDMTVEVSDGPFPGTITIQSP